MIAGETERHTNYNSTRSPTDLPGSGSPGLCCFMTCTTFPNDRNVSLRLLPAWDKGGRGELLPCSYPTPSTSESSSSLSCAQYIPFSASTIGSGACSLVRSQENSTSFLNVDPSVLLMSLREPQSSSETAIPDMMRSLTRANIFCKFTSFSTSLRAGASSCVTTIGLREYFVHRC